jgi:transcriptional regulator of acetoin/glycerol metabolism
MEHLATDFGGSTRLAGPLDTLSQLPDDCRLARAAGVNLLVVIPAGVNATLTDLLVADLVQPIVTWRPGEQLVLPSASQTGTLILRDVGALSLPDQRRLLEWLERAAGQTQVVSTTATPLMPLVQAGGFLARLYYRLNTVCVDVSVTQ